MIGICLGVRVVKWLIGIFANATVRTLRSLRSLRVLMAAAASTALPHRERVVEVCEASAAAVAKAFCKPSEFHYAVCPLLVWSHIAISDDSRRCGVSPRWCDAPGRCVSLGCDARRMNQGDAASRRVGK